MKRITIEKLKKKLAKYNSLECKHPKVSANYFSYYFNGNVIHLCYECDRKLREEIHKAEMFERRLCFDDRLK